MAPQDSERFVAVTHQSPNKRSVFLIILIITLLIAIVGGIFALFVGKSTKTPISSPKQTSIPAYAQASASAQPALPAINSNSNTAARYFNVKSDAIDFRDGAMGDFSTTITKNNNTVSLSYDNKIQAGSVTVYDLGRLDILTDHFIVFALSFINPAATITPAQGTTPAPIPTPATALPNPYTIGDVPQGYYNTTPKNQQGQQAQTPQTIFKSGRRYSIEVAGTDQSGKIKIASNTFTY